MKLSKRIMETQSSPIRKFYVYSREAEAKGKKVYYLNIGQPDIKTPDVFFDAVKNFSQDVLAYAGSEGVPELIDAIRDYYKRYGMNYERDEVLITNGGSEAITFIMSAILDPGDNVLMAEPFYTNYNTFVKMAGGEVKPIPTSPEDGYKYAYKERIEALIDDKTRAIVAVNPGNPTGTVLSKEEIEMICDIAIERDLFIIADEVYREFVYDGLPMSSFGMVEKAVQNVIITDSISKRFSACGARIGCVISKNKDLMGHILNLCQGRLCCPTLDQVGAAALYKLPESYFNATKVEYENRRDAVYAELSKIDGIVCEKPSGAFYITAKLPVENAEDFLIFLLTEYDDNGETVMFAPAEGFYATPGMGRSEMRIAYVLDAKDMVRGVEIIRKGIDAYKAKGGK